MSQEIGEIHGRRRRRMFNYRQLTILKLSTYFAIDGLHLNLKMPRSVKYTQQWFRANRKALEINSICADGALLCMLYFDERQA
jgi:hypothetical protein